MTFYFVNDVLCTQRSHVNLLLHGTDRYLMDFDISVELEMGTGYHNLVEFSNQMLEAIHRRV